MTPPRSGIGGASGAQYPYQTRMDAEKANLRQLYTKPVNVPKYAHIVGRASAKVGGAIWRAEAGTRGMLLSPKRKVGSAW